ncbi:hypothetical protein Syun_025419 [Stephania yunnanensis]|uniref:Uncharacterized protein n=1 Tax=Stephania yunnanensis TaxID=152371 RepID=A0AAP0ES51_9MAGN
MDTADCGDLVEVSAAGGEVNADGGDRRRLRYGRSKGASTDLAEKAEGKAAAARRKAKEGRWPVQRKRRMDKIVHLTTKMDDEDLQVSVGG